jgi:hypothetical protein
VTSHNTPTSAGQTTDAHRRLLRIADLVDEYTEPAHATDNADLMILLFQIRMVLGDDPAQAGRRIFSTRTRST